MKKILVTGSGGYIGRHVVEQLLKLGHKVVAVDLFNSVWENNDSENLVVVNESVFNYSETAFERYGKPDVCIHLAWRNGFSHNADSHLLDFSDHFKFLKSLIDSGIKAVSVMGTMHEIGYYEGAVDENTPCNPMSNYGIAKNALRQALIQAIKDTETKLYWLRAYYILGDDIKNHSIFSKLLEMDKQGKKTFPFNSGKNKYDFINVDDLAYQISVASTQSEVDGIINVCTGRPVSLGERVEEFIKDNNLSIKLEYGAFPDREYDSPAIWGDSTKIEKIIKNM